MHVSQSFCALDLFKAFVYMESAQFLQYKKRIYEAFVAVEYIIMRSFEKFKLFNAKQCIIDF